MQANKILSIPETLTTERLVLSRLRMEDAEEIFYTYASKPESTKFVSWPTHQSIKDTREFLRRTTAAWREGVDYSFSIRLKETGRFLGGCGFINDEGKVQIGYVFGSLHWGKGYATEATKKMLEILTGQAAVYRIGSFIDAENTTSAKVLLKAGLVEEACLHDWFRFPNQGNVPKDCILFRMPE